MNKKQYSILILILLFGAFFLTNPKEEEHKSAVKTKLNVFFQKKIAQESKGNDVASGLGATLGSYLLNQIIDTSISRDNYGLFSLTRFTFQKENKVIGVGALGNVFLSSKFDEAIQKNGMDGVLK